MTTQPNYESGIRTPAVPPDDPIIIDGCGHKHSQREFRFEGKGFFGRIHAAILNWLRRNSD